MSTTPPPTKHTISNLTYPLPRWRYYILFQSWPQFESWIAIITLSTTILYFLLEILDPNIAPIEGIAIGTGIGSLFSIFSVIPTQFTISSHNQNHRKLILKQLEYFGYIKYSDDNNIIVFHQKLPRLLRWDEGNITIFIELEMIKISGPMSILKLIRNNLIKILLKQSSVSDPFINQQ